LLLSPEGQQFLFPELECKSCKKETFNEGLCDDCADDWCRGLVVD